MASGINAPHHDSRHTRAARVVRAMAYADPDTKCWRCGRTLAQHPPHKTGAPAVWHAGHVVDGQVGGPLLPEASTCNTSSGASYGNRKRERATRTELSW